MGLSLRFFSFSSLDIVKGREGKIVASVYSSRRRARRKEREGGREKKEEKCVIFYTFLSGLLSALLCIDSVGCKTCIFGREEEE